MMSEDELFATTNSNPAKSWGLETGKIAANLAADIIVGKKRTGNPLDAFFHLDPPDILLVMQKGSIRLFDESLLPQLKDNFPLSNYSKVYVEKNCKYVQGNIPALMNEVLKVYPEADFPVKA